MPVVDDPHAVGERVRLLEVLRRQEDGDPVLVREPRNLRPQRCAALQVKAGRRLVEEEDPRLVDERQRQVQAALHPARVAADPAIAASESPTRSSSSWARRDRVGPRYPLQRSLEHQMLAAGQDRVKRGLLQCGPDRCAHVRAIADDVIAADARPPAGGRQQRRQHQHGRRLPRAVGPEEAVDLAGRDRRSIPSTARGPFLNSRTSLPGGYLQRSSGQRGERRPAQIGAMPLARRGTGSPAARRGRRDRCPSLLRRSAAGEADRPRPRRAARLRDIRAA
jgi:hypothetical protein